MYSIERIHVSQANDQHFQVLQMPPHGKTIAIYDENHAVCGHYAGCHPGECATANCMRVVKRTEEIIQEAGFRL